MNSTRNAIATFCLLMLAACTTIPGGPPAQVRESLAPTGKLRVALFDGNAVHMIKDKSTGEAKGVGHDLGRILAARLGVPFEPMPYAAFPTLLDAGKSGAWDIAFLGVSADRTEYLDFTQNHIEIDYGYLVPPGSTITDMGAVDRPGIRVAVVARGTPDIFLSGALKNASLVRAPGLQQALRLVSDRQADLMAGAKPAMLGVAAQLPGSRVLEGRPGGEEAALAMPKGRGAEANAYARAFIAEAKADGTVKAAIDRAGLQGVTVAP